VVLEGVKTLIPEPSAQTLLAVPAAQVVARFTAEGDPSGAVTFVPPCAVTTQTEVPRMKEKSRGSTGEIALRLKLRGPGSLPE
jgi:hypothetical protein